jgi:hypothetical protein
LQSALPWDFVEVSRCVRGATPNIFRAEYF